jgi:fumarate hydratase class II
MAAFHRRCCRGSCWRSDTNSDEEEKGYRPESDAMGEVRLPLGVYWGAQTQWAIGNFGAPETRIPVALIEALGLIKRCRAKTNAKLGLLDRRSAEAVIRAADEVVSESRFGPLEDILGTFHIGR